MEKERETLKNKQKMPFLGGKHKNQRENKKLEQTQRPQNSYQLCSCFDPFCNVAFSNKRLPPAFSWKYFKN